MDPHRIGGWEIHRKLVDPDLAEAAGLVALRFYENAKSLPFIYQRSSRSNRAYIGLWSPTVEVHKNLHSYPAEFARAEPLLKVLQNLRLHNIFHDEERESIGWQPSVALIPKNREHVIHQDMHEGQRVVVTLLGACTIILGDNRTNHVEVHDQFPGDAYVMNCTNDEESSPFHGVAADHGLCRVSLMIENKGSISRTE